MKYLTALNCRDNLCVSTVMYWLIPIIDTKFILKFASTPVNTKNYTLNFLALSLKTWGKYCPYCKHNFPLFWQSSLSELLFWAVGLSDIHITKTEYLVHAHIFSMAEVRPYKVSQSSLQVYILWLKDYITQNATKKHWIHDIVFNGA